MKQWILTEFPPDDPDSEVVLKGMIQGKLQKMNECYRYATELMTPERVWQSETETLEKYVSMHGVTQ